MSDNPAQRPADQRASDIHHVELTLQGDRYAFDHIVRRYTGVIYGLAHRMLGGPEDAADAVQEIFLRAYSSLDSFDCARPFYPWLYSIALNHLRSAMRRRARRIQAFSFEHGAQNGTEPFDPPDATADPERQAVLRLTERHAQAALNRLPARYREVFVLRTINELSVHDVARILRISPSAVKSRMHRARRALAEALDQTADTAVEPEGGSSGVHGD